MQHESRSIQPEDTKSVRANLKMGAGELNLTGGAGRLMEGDFSYNVAEWRPKVTYEVSGDEGNLVAPYPAQPPNLYAYQTGSKIGSGAEGFYAGLGFASGSSSSKSTSSFLLNIRSRPSTRGHCSAGRS